MFNKPPKFDDLFANVAESNKKWFENLMKVSKGEQSVEENPMLDTFRNFASNTQNYLESQTKFYQEQLQMWSNILGKPAATEGGEPRKVTDRRFGDPEWDNNPFYACLRHSYDNFAKHLHEAVDKSDKDDEAKNKMKFFMQQYIDAISPSNFAMTNPEVIKKVIETNGQSLADGMKNMLDDIQNGYITMTDESAYAVGENLAATEGSVVYRNNLVEVIQYKPTTEKVHEVPLVIVPPCINKYYILDLQQSNSFVKYFVDQGFSVFLVSWKSADASIRTYRWEEYVNQGVIESIEVVRAITKKPKVNTVGYCVGGAILTSAAVLMKERKLDYVNSMMHLTTMLDYSDPGEIKVFLNGDMQKLRSAKKDLGGVMSGRIISQTFSALRANDLIWNYWVNNYLMGKTPQKFDILYWNNDIVDLPLPMHAFYMESLYYKNQFAKGEFTVDGVKLDLSKIDYPVYLFAAQKDHIVPWDAAYKSVGLLKNAQVKFVLGASGHTAGVVNPANSGKRNYWVNEKAAKNMTDWFNGATSMPGSWWVDASAWLANLSGKEIKALAIGNKDYKAICAAPGEYVKAKGLTIVEAEAI